MVVWDDLRFLLSVERTGTLSAAANQLRVTQSTVGRRLSRLESTLGVRLMDKTPDGYIRTSVAEDILSEIERLERSIEAIVQIADSRTRKVDGVVRISCAEPIASRIVAPCIAVLHKKHPAITVHLRNDARVHDLMRREIDIDVRMVRPDQKELAVRRLSSVAFGLYASSSYAEFFRSSKDVPFAYVLLEQDGRDIFRHARWFSDLFPSSRILLRTNNYEAQFSCTLNHGGLSCFPRFHADLYPELVRLDEVSSPPDAVAYLTIHRNNSDVPRIRIVADAISRAIGELVPIKHAPASITGDGPDGPVKLLPL
ncbi:DNA-binding transcriptional LysR family regulator [Bradyrhizobium huanghuaihaiense]|uniref:DNA-binding transcriptional LysR family regulator n=1 Tax=Bradyrhizobium huanghuaihaiense TaxID=990078 RepID=A0A562R425_9BRAD|nr:LysR family transcriptional regulator [Bradyrhizobium huanghuaihaiense]TWI63807.1 DNA-binding transcriptional LysR family regulator [Bradyrhizobium huanghuaihaiense]